MQQSRGLKNPKRIWTTIKSILHSSPPNELLSHITIIGKFSGFLLSPEDCFPQRFDSLKIPWYCYTFWFWSASQWRSIFRLLPQWRRNHGVSGVNRPPTFWSTRSSGVTAIVFQITGSVDPIAYWQKLH